MRAVVWKSPNENMLARLYVILGTLLDLSNETLLSLIDDSRLNNSSGLQVSTTGTYSEPDESNELTEPTSEGYLGLSARPCMRYMYKNR